MTLTEKAIEKLKAGATRREVPDRDGLYLVIQPSGAKSWAYRYRHPIDGKARKLTIGGWPGYGLADARAELTKARALVQRGSDPSEAAKTARALARDRSDLVDDHLDRYLEAYEASHKPSSYAEVARLFRVWVRTTIGRKRPEEVTRRDVQGILDAMVKRGAAVSANRLLAALRPFFASIRIGGEPLPRLPTDAIDKPADETGRDRDRVLSDAEIRWLWKATEDPSAFSSAVRLMLLTGQRRGEVSGMTVSELDLEASTWLLPAVRTKNGRENLVPLTEQALASIRRPPRVGRSKLVLTSTSGTELSGWSKSKVALDARMLAVAVEETGRPPNIEPWVLHDLRRTTATGMARLEQPIHVIEAVLNHKTGQIGKLAGIYNRHAYESEKWRALLAWENHITRVAGQVRSGALRPSEVKPDVTR